MKQFIGHTSLLVKDYDDAIDFYVNKLHFKLIEDTHIGEGKRWVLIAPKGASEFSLLLAKATSEKQLEKVGNQTGGRVFLFLYTDDISRDYKNLLEQHITIIREPKKEPYGTVAVFADIYGNQWDLIEPEIKKQNQIL